MSQSSFRKLICNLLLNVHPICINKWTHPILAKSIHQYYLNYETIWLEYKRKEKEQVLLDQPNNDDPIFDDYDDPISDDPITNIMQHATITGNTIIVKWCLKNGANIHANNDIALQLAAELDHLEIVKILVANGANIRANNDIALISSNNTEIIKFLLENVKDSLSEDNIIQGLLHACNERNKEVIKLLATYL